jgi:hypothetical protein
MATNQKTEGTAKAVETKNETLHLVVSPKSNFGLIAYTLSVKLNLEQLIQRSAEGLLHVAQRAPASRVEKTMAYPDKKREQMPADWTRSDIGYSDAKARQFESELAKEIRKLTHLDVAVVADRYEPTERDVKYAEAKKMVKHALAVKKLSNLVKNSGFAGRVTADTAVESIDFLQAVDAYRQRLITEQALA